VIGRTLSHYRILEKLGAGGMGEVYRAHDEKLGRDVAVKVLPPGLLSHEEARARFRKEALALSRLSHPHIATLLDFDTADGIDLLVMELVEGRTLREAVREGPLAEKDVVRLGSQLARGLAVAHEHGVIHRDLKPGNLALTPDGLLKILDFGLARLERLTLPVEGEKTASTDTAVGHVVGTPAYMAPEQLRGRGVDGRTDISGAGACLYELATGRRPFGSKSGVELTDAVLHEAPASPRSVSGTVLPGLESVILKCLDKDPELRYQTAKELLVDLERLQVAATSGVASQPVAVVERGRRRRWLAIAAATVLALAALAWFLWPAPPPRVTAVRPLTGDLTPEGPAATDGQRLYFVATRSGRTDLFQVPVSGGEPVAIPLPFAFFRRVQGYVPRESALLMLGASAAENDDAADFGVPIWLVPVPAGAARRIGNLRASWAHLSGDGRMLVFTRGPTFRDNRLFVARADGSAERLLMAVPSGARWVRWAPDGIRVRFSSRGPQGHEREGWIWETSIAGEAPRPLWPGHVGDWTQDGRYFVFDRDSAAAPHSLFAARETGPSWPWRRAPQPLTFGPLAHHLAASDPKGGKLFAAGALARGELLRYNPETKRFEPALGGESASCVEPSPDGRWLAWVRYPDRTLWRSRPDGGERLQLTSTPLEANLPRWSPDGLRIVYAGRSPEDPQLSIRTVAADGSAAELLARPEDPKVDYWDPCWLPDGSIVFSRLSNDDGSRGLFRLDAATGRTDPLPGAENLQYPKCSRQGHLLAHRFESGGGRQVVRRAGAETWEDVGGFALSYINWTRDGRSFCGLDYVAVAIECVSLDARRVERVAQLAGTRVLVWGSAPWMGLDADDRPLITADRSTSALYALDWEAR